MAEHRIVFLTQNKSGRFEQGTAIRDAALALGILIESSCAGIGSCAKCKVVVKEGGTLLTAAEKQLLTRQEIDKGVRLACHAEIAADCLCIVPDSSLPFSQENRIQIAGVDHHAELQPEIKKVRIPLTPPELGSKYFYLEQILASLQQSGAAITGYDMQAARDLPKLLEQKAAALTAIISGTKLIAFEAIDKGDDLYGVAVDIGTTTVAAKLLDLSSGEVLAVTSAMNAQSAYGADVVARIYYCALHVGGAKRLHRVIIKQINAMLENLVSQAGISQTEIYKCVIAGNTVMQHLMLNVNPMKLGTSPYAPILQGPVRCEARELGLEIHPAGAVHVMPNLGGYVGSDMTAVLSVLDLERSEKLQIVVDLGTNGEVVLGDKNRLLCCSSPAGPAWEGACITWGMRAAKGAIERAEIIDGDLQLKTVGNAAPTGICGSGLLDLLGEFYRAGIIHSSGRILPPEMLPEKTPPQMRKRIRKAANGQFEIQIAHLENSRWITLTQADVRELQLAKAAIAAGIRLLLKEQKSVPNDIANIYIAGAFGYHIRAQDVVELGMLPDIPPEKIHFIGNAALTGAEAVLCSETVCRKAETITKSVEYVEISGRPDFQDAFVEAIPFRKLEMESKE